MLNQTFPDTPGTVIPFSTASSSHWCTFRLGSAWFAVGADRVVEVLERRHPTPVPLAAPELLGLVQLRGRIVPVILPAAGLGLPVPPVPGNRLLVFTAGDDWYALVVDEVMDILAIPRDRIEPPTTAGAVLVGTFPAPGGLVHLVDPEAMLERLAREPAALRSPETTSS